MEEVRRLRDGVLNRYEVMQRSGVDTSTQQLAVILADMLINMYKDSGDQELLFDRVRRDMETKLGSGQTQLEDMRVRMADQSEIITQLSSQQLLLEGIALGVSRIPTLSLR